MRIVGEIDPDLRLRVAAKVLARIRRERGVPAWRATGMLNGGVEMALKTRARMRRLLERRERERKRREVEGGQ